MDITDIRVRKANGEGRTKAFCSVTFDDEFVVHEIRVIESENGLFIAMPSKKRPDGGYRDVAHPISQAARDRIQAVILEAFNNEINRASECAAVTE